MFHAIMNLNYYKMLKSVKMTGKFLGWMQHFYMQLPGY